MSATSVQFAVAVHIMAALAYQRGKEVSSSALANSVNANASFVRKSLSKLAKAGLVITARGKSGGTMLGRSAARITLLDIYRASEAPAVFAVHQYPKEQRCAVSCGFKDSMTGVLDQAQNGFEKTLSDITLADVLAGIGKREK